MTDIVERLIIWPAADGADALAGHFVEALMQEAVAEITKLRAERDAAARDMRERALAAVQTEGQRVSNELATPPNVRGLMADDHALKFGVSVTDRLYRAIHALPDTPAVIATDGGTNG